MAPDGRTPESKGSDDTTKYLRYLLRAAPLSFAEPAVQQALLQEDLVMASVQPAGLKAFPGLSVAGSTYFAARNKSGIHAAKMQHNLRDLEKVRKKADMIRCVEEEEPGVIPRTLETVEAILGRFHAEEQPRFEAILDAVHGTLAGAGETLGNVNRIVGSIVDFAAEHSLLVKIGIGVAACGCIATLVLIPLVLLRILLFGV